MGIRAPRATVKRSPFPFFYPISPLLPIIFIHCYTLRVISLSKREARVTYFPVAGVETNPLYPVGAAFLVSYFCSMGGVSGAFLLLPWQMSCLGYVTPGASATNLIFNLLACPAGVLRYARDKRLLLPLAAFVSLASLPGVFIGAWSRLTFLAGKDYFFLFASVALFYLGWRLRRSKAPARVSTNKTARVLWVNRRGFAFAYGDAEYRVAATPLMLAGFAVGVAGSAYGVGGGAVMAPFLSAVMGLPIGATAGATLLSTFISSLGGAFSYYFLAILTRSPHSMPDIGLGILLGLGGFCGAWLGAASQKFVSEKILRAALTLLVFSLAIWYFIKSTSELFIL